MNKNSKHTLYSRVSRRRLNIELTEDQKVRLNHLVPDGMLRGVYSRLTDALLECLEEDDSKWLYLILEGMIEIKISSKGLDRLKKEIEQSK